MRFLFASAFKPERHSGAAGTLIAIGEALAAQGHVVDFEWQPARPSRIPHPTGSRLLELPKRQLEQVSRRLAAAHYDVVIVSQPYAYLVYERLAPRYPTTLFLNRTHGWEARLYAAQRRFGFADSDALPHRLLSRFSEALTRRACRRTALASHGIIAPASACARHIRESYGLAPERTAVIPYGVDHHPPSGASQPLCARRGQRMLFVGNYVRRKGSHILESVLPPLAREFPQSSLTFVVNDSAIPVLEARYRGSFGDRLTIFGWMERQRLQSAYATHDILLYPSLFEGFGKVWLEAMTSGLCVVGFAEGGLPDVARNGEEAWWCAPGDTDTLGALLRRVLSHSRQAAEIGERARRRVGGFSWERTAAETVAYCRRVHPTPPA